MALIKNTECNNTRSSANDWQTIYLVKIKDEMRLVGDLEALLPPAQALRLVLLQLLEQLKDKIRKITNSDKLGGRFKIGYYSSSCLSRNRLIHSSMERLG